MIKIYGLICPLSNQIRYIGRTAKKLNVRLSEHLREEKSITKKQKWILSLKEKDLKPKAIVLCYADKSNWIEKEKEYIDLLRKTGLDLTNTTHGWKHTKEWRLIASKRMTIRMKEHPFDAKFYDELNKGKRKRITRIDNNGNEVNFESVADAAKELIHLQKDNSLTKTSTNISNCLNGRAKKAFGYKWEYQINNTNN